MKIEQMGLDPETQIETLKFSWSDGSWWDLKSELDWNTSRKIRIILGAATPDDRPAYLLSAQESQTARLVGSTLGWSFKSSPGEAAIGRLADWRVRETLETLAQYQSKALEVVTEETKKGSVCRLFSAVRSRLFGARRWRITTS